MKRIEEKRKETIWDVFLILFLLEQGLYEQQILSVFQFFPFHIFLRKWTCNKEELLEYNHF